MSYVIDHLKQKAFFIHLLFYESVEVSSRRSQSVQLGVLPDDPLGEFS